MLFYSSYLTVCILLYFFYFLISALCSPVKLLLISIFSFLLFATSCLLIKIATRALIPLFSTVSLHLLISLSLLLYYQHLPSFSSLSPTSHFTVVPILPRKSTFFRSNTVTRLTHTAANAVPLITHR